MKNYWLEKDDMKFQEKTDKELVEIYESYRRHNWYSPDDPRGTLGKEIEQIALELKMRKNK